VTEGHSVITLCKYFCCTLPPAMLLFFLAFYFLSLPLALPSQIFISICELRFSFSAFTRFPFSPRSPRSGEKSQRQGCAFVFPARKGILLSVDVSGVIARAALSAGHQIGGQNPVRQTDRRSERSRSQRQILRMCWESFLPN